ncbi:CCCH RNA binding domains-containing protein [Cryptosporidium canis]|uniref:CCCH RNA binding domains-containing protein n=1 Tax=Cryptosporidium canis TaxID=195482 RepID=A0ABQ8P9S8_9CRYT|nr:CCCH RNA binding domains-containing protein [Cryptosporidium canis]KAJ1612634.1 CCCH RNA binding domains-containing protein [Cryptosporidium canis]
MPLSQNMSMTELSRFRTRICERKALHGVCELDERCPFSHCLSWHRRNPYEYAYRPNLCPNVVFQNENKKMRVKNYCQRGRMCMFSHTKEEQMYHVLVYKTQLCREYPLCTKHYCPFAHGLDELRNPETIDFNPVQGPEVIERQRLVHDCNKFNEVEQSEGKNDSNVVKNKEAVIRGGISAFTTSPSNSPMNSNAIVSKASPNVDQTARNQNNKYSTKSKSHSSNSNHTPKKGGRGSGFNNNKTHSNRSRHHPANEPLKGEQTPINKTNESPHTPSTGCETPIHYQNRLVYSGSKNDSRKNHHKDFQRKEIDRITGSSPGSRGTYSKIMDGEDIMHARDHVNIPPPPYGAIGLNFPPNDGLNSNTESSSLVPSYDYAKYPWGNYGYLDRKNALNNRFMDYEKNKMFQQDSNSSIDDYVNSTSVERMSYLMHMQLLSLSDQVGKQMDAMGQCDPEWSLSNPAFAIPGMYNGQIRDSSFYNHPCGIHTDFNPGPLALASHQNATRCPNDMHNVSNSSMLPSNSSYFDDYGFDFINDSVPDQALELRDANDSLPSLPDLDNTSTDNSSSSWNMFHPSLLGPGNNDGNYWTERR